MATPIGSSSIIELTWLGRDDTTRSVSFSVSELSPTIAVAFGALDDSSCGGIADDDILSIYQGPFYVRPTLHKCIRNLNA